MLYRTQSKFYMRVACRCRTLGLSNLYRTTAKKGKSSGGGAIPTGLVNGFVPAARSGRTTSFSASESDQKAPEVPKFKMGGLIDDDGEVSHDERYSRYAGIKPEGRKGYQVLVLLIPY